MTTAEQATARELDEALARAIRQLISDATISDAMAAGDAD